MMKIDRFMTNICSDDVSASKDFYTKLFELKVAYDSDWFVNLVATDSPFELGIIDRTHSLVPKAYQHTPQGFYLTYVVQDADAVFEVAQREGFSIVAAPSDTAYGQRRLLLKDPDGTLVDVSSPIPDFQF